MPFVPRSFLLQVVMPGATNSVLVTRKRKGKEKVKRSCEEHKRIYQQMFLGPITMYPSSFLLLLVRHLLLVAMHLFLVASCDSEKFGIDPN